MEKFCPTVAVKGNRITLGEPVPLVRPEEPSPELGIAPIVGVVAAKLVLPAIATVGGLFGLHFLGKEFEKAKPVFAALVPLAITGTGIYAFSQVTPLFKPVREEYPTEEEFESAQRTFRLTRIGAGLGLAGLATWSLAALAKVFVEPEKPTPKEEEKIGYQPKPGEVEELRIALQAIRPEQIRIGTPTFTLLEQTGLVWEAFRIEVRIFIGNLSDVKLPALWFAVEDAEKGITLFESRTKEIPPHKELVNVTRGTISEWKHGSLPYADHIKLRVLVGESRDAVFKESQVFTLSPIQLAE